MHVKHLAGNTNTAKRNDATASQYAKSGMLTTEDKNLGDVTTSSIKTVCEHPNSQSLTSTSNQDKNANRDCQNLCEEPHLKHTRVDLTASPELMYDATMNGRACIALIDNGA